MIIIITRVGETKRIIHHVDVMLVTSFHSQDLARQLEFCNRQQRTIENTRLWFYKFIQQEDLFPRRSVCIHIHTFSCKTK